MKPSTTCFHAAWLFTLALFFVLFAGIRLPAHGNIGYIQVTCEPGVLVFVDGELKGTTSVSQGGLIISSVSATRHLLRFEKKGYYQQEAAVDVGYVEVLEYKVRPFTPKPETSEHGSSAKPQVEQKVGSILLQSLPVACTIRIPALGVNGYEKYRNEVEFDKLPIGTYLATFSALGKSVDRTITIADGECTRLFVDLLNAKAPEAITQPPVEQSVPAITKTSVENRLIPDLGLTLVWIAPGSFVMGNSVGGENDEKPVSQVKLSYGFWLGRTEVTQAQWRAIMGNNPARFQGDDLPVETVNWIEATDFCRKMTQRESAAGRLPSGYVYTLPTEAQWEYACRAGTTGNHAGVLDGTAWYIANSGDSTKPVGQKKPNAWGLQDMHGNVWEWCFDNYGNYPGGSVTDPKGAGSGIYRVIRGGSWNNSADYCRSGLRLRDEPQCRRNYLGFRLALSPVP